MLFSRETPDRRRHRVGGTRLQAQGSVFTAGQLVHDDW